ncbi:hypothetical protein HHI36_008387 [Cryptolaemus montrouzieri]|uniref:Uncharacterized protein n=1 Tax=Cryptolaemus montrouzieri TaxID=559131 RepID=A0ABD2MSU8_9CUCU
MSCSNADSKVKLRQEVQEKLWGKYIVEDPYFKNPKIEIKDVEKLTENSDEDIIQKLIDLNELEEVAKDKVKIIKKYVNKRRYNSPNIILDVRHGISKTIIQRGRMNIGWRECDIEEYFDVAHCCKYAGLNHFPNDCRNVVTCFKCTDNQ